MKNKRIPKISMIILITVLTLSSIMTTLPVSAQEVIQTYPYLGIIPNPVQINQPVLFHIGISAQRSSVDEGWEGLSITIIDPEGEETTLTGITTDSTGGTGVGYTPTKLGTYHCTGHFPETTVTVTPFFGTPYNATYLASDTEVVDMVVQAEAIPYYPGHAQPDFYWTRPINGQFYEWRDISGDWLRPAGSYTMPPIPKYHAGNADAPEAAHVLWTKEYTQGGLASADLGIVQYEMGDAYELKFMGSVIMTGVLYYNRYEDQGSDPALEQDVVAVDLKTGEEKWVKNWNNERLAFGQTFYFDSYNYHGVFGYLWTEEGTTWKAYDPLTGRWEYTMENVPSGYNMYGPKGEIFRYTVDLNNGWMTLWNSSRVVMNGVTGPMAGSWRPQGNTYDATLGIEWNKTIPTGLPGSACSYHLFDKIVGSTSGGIFGGTSPDITNWAIDVSPGHEGTMVFETAETIEPAGMTLVYSETIPENDVMIVSAKEDRKYYAFSLTTGDLKWVTEPESYLAFYDKWYGPAYGYGRFFTGRVSGIVTCYNLTDGEVLWTYDVKDEYAEMTWGNNFHITYHFLADGKICLSYAEHSPLNPIPRGGPLVVLDVESGDPIWQLSWVNNWWGGHVMIGDSTMVGLNGYDNRLYAIGKGPSQTTVAVKNNVLTKGSSLLIDGTILDVSPGTETIALRMRFPNGVPAVADEAMTDWMQHVYMQYEKPTDVQGVDVFVKVQDPNGAWYSDTVTTDEKGVFSMVWVPEVVGEYHVTAMFEGTNSYYRSEATTVFVVDEAPVGPGYEGPSADEIATRTVNMMPQFPNVPTAEEIASDAAQRTINMLPAYPETTCPDMPAYLTIDLAVIVLVVIAIILVLYGIIKKK
jgi:outer membrane protein assembly factor BamB